MKQSIPYLLIITRVIIGFAMIFLAYRQLPHYPSIAVVLFAIGLLTDIFDGIIARQMGISSTRLRRWDSTADQVFFISVAVATYLQCPGFFRNNAVWLCILLGTEALTYVVSFIKFRKEVATHSIGAKLWTLVMFATLVQVMFTCDSEMLFQVCFWLGMATRAEIIAIILVLKQWTNDVPTVYHAVQLRKGKTIQRNKLFNG